MDVVDQNNDIQPQTTYYLLLLSDSYAITINV